MTQHIQCNIPFISDYPSGRSSCSSPSTKELQCSPIGPFSPIGLSHIFEILLSNKRPSNIPFFLFAYLVQTCFLVCLSNNISSLVRSLVRSLVSSFRFGSVGVCCCSIYKILFRRNLCLFSPMLCCYCFCCCCEKEISFCRLFVHISLFFLSLSCIILD